MALSSYDVGWNGLVATSAAGQKEIISDVLTQLSIEDKPTFAMLGDDVADGLYWQWGTDRLATRTTAGATEGQAAGSFTATNRRKLANYVQHFQGDFSVTLDQIEMSRRGQTWGVKNELQYQAGKVTLEKHLDVNARAWSLTSADAPVSGGNTTAQLTGNFHYWARNTVQNAGTNDGVSGSTFLGYTPATQFVYSSGAFSSADITTVGKAMRYNGVNPNTIFMPDAMKIQFDAAIFGQTASGTLIRNTDALQGNEYGAVIDVFRNSIGRYAVVQDRTMPTNSSTADVDTSAEAILAGACWYMADRNQMKKAWWRHFQPYDVATNADTKAGYVRGSLGFKVTNPYAIGGVYGCTAA